jgi:hypothetical protein
MPTRRNRGVKFETVEAEKFVPKRNHSSIKMLATVAMRDPLFAVPGILRWTKFLDKIVEGNALVALVTLPCIASGNRDFITTIAI